MTPEQNEKWKKTVLPIALEIHGGHGLTGDALVESFDRLENWEVPGWAAELRISILHLGDSEPWCPNFAIRSEAALMGIQILRDNDPYLWAVYQRLFVRFVAEALRPFVEWIREHDDYRRGGYSFLVQLFELCERLPLPVDEWLETWRMTSDAQYRHMPEFDHAKELVVELRREARIIFQGEVPWGSARPLEPLLEHLNRQHQWRLEGKAATGFTDGANYTRLIADAYLIALEAQCPAPDWLPLR